MKLYIEFTELYKKFKALHEQKSEIPEKEYYKKIKQFLGEVYQQLSLSYSNPNNVIAELKDDELQALKKSEKKYRTIYETAASLILSVDINQNIIECNNQIETLLGYSKTSILGKSMFAIIHPDYQKEAKKTFAIIKKQGFIHNKECVMQKINGEKVTVILNSTTLKDKNREFLQSVCIINDISEREKIEEDLRHEIYINKILVRISKEILSPELSIEKIAEIIHDASLKLTRSEIGYVSSVDIYTNENIIHAFNDKTNYFINNISALPNDEDEYDTIWGYTMNIKKPFFSNNIQNELVFKCFTDDTSQLNNILSVPAIAHDKLLGQIALANSKDGYQQTDLDTIENLANIYALAIFRKHIEDELLEANKKSEESSRLKTAFLANMSHELRTPMNAILGFSNLLEKDNLPEDKRKYYIQLVNINTKQLLTIIKDIIDLSRIEAGMVEIDRNEIHLNQLISELFTQFKMELDNDFAKSGIELKVKTELPNDEDIISTDDIRLRQILMCLLSNAVKFTEKGFIEFGYTANTQKRQLIFFVKDTGLGIDKTKLPIVFERFRQEDESYTRKFGGTGLGLTISKGLVELLGGEIWVESEKSKGSVFWFTHPYSKGKKQEKTDEKIAAKYKQFNFTGKKILIVDDLEINLKFFETVLKFTNATCLFANSGEEALETCKKLNIDLVLLDIQLTEENGYEVLKKIKNIRPKIPVIAQTSYGLDNDEIKAYTSGFDDYISKPIDIQMLYKKIDKFIIKK